MLQHICSTKEESGILLAYHLPGSDVAQLSFQVTKLSEVDLILLREDIKEAVGAKYTSKSCVLSANTVCYSGTRYATGMTLANGSTRGFPDFVYCGML